MTQKHILTSLTLLIFLALAGGQVFFGQAAALPETDVTTRIDATVWQAVAASPAREVTVVVSLLPEGGGDPEYAIDAQFRLEQMLELLAETGSVSDYQAFYGANIIKITGGLGLLRLLEGWPELEGVAHYQPGAAWELQAESALRSETLSASGLMVGKVTASNGGAPLEGIRVTAYRLTGGVSWEVAGTAFTNASGDYAVSGLVTGIYRARFDDPAGNYATQFFDNKTTFQMATNFNVTDGQVTPNINGSLALAGKISGTVTKVGGGNLKDIAVSAHTDVGGTWQFVANAISASNGVYTIGSLPPGIYRVRFADIYSPPSYLVQWYNGKLNEYEAQDIIVSAGATVTGINAAMGSYGSITGNIKADGGVTNLAGITVDAFHSSGTWVSYGESDANGNYVVSGLSTGDFKLRFSDPLGQFAAEYYDNKPDLASANPVSVVLGYATPNINAQLALKVNTVSNSLVSGWNLVSLPVGLADGALPGAFNSISGSYGDVYAWLACNTPQSWVSFVPTRPFNSLETVNTTQGYWLNMTSPGTLTLEGTFPVQTQITLCLGWNLIGYPSLATRPVADALASISGKYSLVRQYRAGEDPLWRTFSPTSPPIVNTLKNLEPGYGYWIYMTQAATLVIAGR
jgi:hypothetical protein